MACSPSKPLPWTPTPRTYTPRFVPCERMWPGSHPRGGVNPNDGLLRHIAQIWASLSSWPSLPIGSGPPGPLLRRPTVWCGSSGSMLACLRTLSYAIQSCAPCFYPSQFVELAMKRQCNWWETCSFCAVYNKRSAAVCVFIRGDSYAQWNKDTVNHNQMGVCREGGGLPRLGGGVCVPWMFKGDVEIQCGTPETKDRGGWQCVAFGKIRIGKEWMCCLLIEWAQELQKSLIKQEVLSNHCSLPLFHNQECNCNIMRVAWHGLHKPFTDTEPQNPAVFMQPYCHLTNKHL